MTLKEAVAAANAAGISYGEYVKRERERKAAQMGMSYDDVVTGRGEDRRIKTLRQTREHWTPKREAARLRRATAVIATDTTGREVRYHSIKAARHGTGIATNTIQKVIHGERGAWIKGYTFRLADKDKEDQHDNT